MARDPSHPWVGEAVPIDFASQAPGEAVVITDFNSGDPVRYQFDGSTIGLEAGQSFIAGFLTSESLLSGDDAVASFVVEVMAGTGTLRLSSGVDPDFTLTDPADASDPGGTFDVDGPTTLVVPVPSFDVDTYLSQVQEQIGRVECLAGFVVLSQVRLRIWPSTGPVGGWSTDVVPQATVGIAPNRWIAGGGSAITTGTYEGPDPAPLFAAASEEVVALWGASNHVEPLFADWVASPTLTASMVVDTNVGLTSVTPTNYTAAGTVNRFAGVALQPDPDNFTRTSTPSVPGATFGLDYTYPPDIVPGDLTVQLLGTPAVEWGDAVWDGGGIISVDHDEPSYVVTPIDPALVNDPTTLTMPAYGEVPLPITASPHPPQPVAMPPGSRAVMLTLSSTSATSAQGYGGTSGSEWHVGTRIEGFDILLSDSLITVPAYRYWTPTAQPARKLRQYHRDDGLGVAPRRAYGGGSRSNTGRAYGYT